MYQVRHLCNSWAHAPGRSLGIWPSLAVQVAGLLGLSSVTKEGKGFGRQLAIVIKPGQQFGRPPGWEARAPLGSLLQEKVMIIPAKVYKPLCTKSFQGISRGAPLPPTFLRGR